MTEEAKKEALRELDRLAQDAARRRRVHGGADLSRVARGAAVEQGDRRTTSTSTRRARGPRRGPLGAREGQGPHPRVPRGQEHAPGRQGSDPVLRGPARRRQDLARALDRAGARAEVPPDLARRHARRGGDPRPPAHLYRRAAGPDHPGAAPRRVEEPGAHARRDRQARDGLPRRSGLGAARGARPRAERRPSATTTSTCRSISRKVALHHDGQRAGHGAGARCATGWRSSSSPATRRRRRCASRGSTSCPKQATDHGHGRGRAHAAGPTRALRLLVRDYTREAGLRNLEREIAAITRKVAKRRVEGQTEPVEVTPERWWASCWAPHASCSRSSRSAPACPAWRWAWPGRRRAATSCSSRRRG